MIDFTPFPGQIVYGAIVGAINCNNSPFTKAEADRVRRELKLSDKPINSKDVYKQKRKMKNNDDEVNLIDDSNRYNVDRISDLPDDVLVYLLSFVDMKTAGRSSLVSKRWRYVWTYLTYLDFEDPEFYVLHQYPFNIKSQDWDRYRNWVNQVMTRNRASYLSTFRIHFPLYGSYADDIGKWIAIALSKNVQNLELNLSTCMGGNTMKGPGLITYMIRQDNLFDNYNRVTSLRSIHFEGLVVEGDVVEYVLSICPNLDRLTVKKCYFNMLGSVPKTQVVVSSSNLKHLELYDCNNIKSIQISAPKLTCFKFLGSEQQVQYTSVPALVNVTFEGGYWYRNCKFNVFSKFSTQLEQLSLSWSLTITSLPTNFPSFPNVKQLEIYVKISGDGKDNLLALIPFIKACPVLHTFKLKLFTIPGLSRLFLPATSVQNDVHIETIRAHKHLAVVEFARFSGTPSEVSLALFLAEHASMLNKLILDPYHPHMGDNTHIYVDFANIHVFDNISLWRRQAEVLAKQIRGGVDVVIL